MRILIINKTLGLGSVGKIVEDLYSAIVMSGNECKIAFAVKKDNTKVPDNDTIKIGSYLDRFVHATLSLVCGKTAFYSKNATKKLIAAIKQYNPDVVHIHGVYGYYVNMELLFDTFSEMKVSVVSTLHSCWDFTGHCCYFDYVGCDKWQSVCVSCPQKRSYPKAFFDNTKRNYLLKRSLYYKIRKCVIVTPSLWLKKLVSNSFLSVFRTKVIYNGIDLSVFNNLAERETVLKKYGVSIETPCVLCVANCWEKRKGFDDVLALAKMVRDIQIIVVGLDDKQFKKLPNNIIGIKRTANMAELALLYSSATILFNPTYEDNYPTVNLEAIACHTPVVTYNTGGCNETIKNGRFGLIIQNKDFSSLVAYMNKVFKKELKCDFSDLTYLKAQTMADNYINLYRELIDS